MSRRARGLPSLYVDVGSPFAYLAAERAPDVLGVAPVLRPVLLGGLFRLAGRGSWALGDVGRRRAGMADIEARALRYGLPALRWPDRWPGDYLQAMLAITAARRENAAEGDALLLSGFRRMFVPDEDLGRDHILDRSRTNSAPQPRRHTPEASSVFRRSRSTTSFYGEMTDRTPCEHGRPKRHLASPSRSGGCQALFRPRADPAAQREGGATLRYFGEILGNHLPQGFTISVSSSS